MFERLLKWLTATRCPECRKRKLQFLRRVPTETCYAWIYQCENCGRVFEGTECLNEKYAEK